MAKPDWQGYYAQTKGRPPSRLLVDALAYVPNKGKAIDIGGGALKDSRYLLSQGFEVTDLDNQEIPPELLDGIDRHRFHHVQSSFGDFNFPKEEYDIASAMFSLPFNPPETFDRVFNSIKQSLRVGGVLCGNLFGIRDEWSAMTGMTFHAIERAKTLLSDMEVLFFEEREYEGTLANGTPKHWHVFDFIAKRIA